MKYIVLVYLALGFVLSSAIGIQYHCDGGEMLPEYFGSPFVFKRKSLGSSMTYFFSISGLLLNTCFWSILLFFARKGIIILLKRAENKLFKTIYKGTVALLVVFTTMNVMLDYMMLGRGFEKGSNYWYMNLSEDASAWGVECKGEWTFFRKPM